MSQKVTTILIVLVIGIIVAFFVNAFLMPHLGSIKWALFGADSKDITEDRKRELEDLATDLYDAIYSWVEVATWEVDAILEVDDKELAYINEYYNKNLTANNMAYDLDWEFMPDTDSDDKLLARVKALGLPGKTGWLDPDNKFSKSQPIGIAIVGAIALGLIAVVLTKGKALQAVA